ncbi:hypothetical protein [Halalkalibacter akibai]|uniref:Uncharacterized protein n=1 Tax=Halalkalibacter akibai (strain ATCC 43226 / DSM 21942 / CIP 109018 / JCM 9157 / 1139) TaxID=1236973 RepID=W4QN08_HALA3|nr:hypothetical protein [Halalkalibacter akibai]GAE33485.1 hypothetical protein JCM9157_488 [Halalkalibacter akibai JCM 9157]
MSNYQQDLMDIMVKKILSKHKVNPASDLTDDDKEKVKKVVGELQSEVERFLDNQNKTLSENDFAQTNQTEAIEATEENATDNTASKTNPVVKESIKKLIEGNNDLQKVKTFINKLNK